ncbi:MAG: apolipoprotein N-acyltransferase [Burkholderiales bacterium]|nr:apolipoprotein N-acyltransferase [Burkholderiales bacterium]
MNTATPAVAGGRGRRPWGNIGVAFVAGVVAVAGFAPLYLFPLPILALAVVSIFAQRAASARHAAWIGFAFGFGLFVAGVSWVYVALHIYGAMPAPLAALVAALFAFILALHPALAAWAARQFRPDRWWLAFPACWVLAEWIRSWIFTGFPWLSVGYSQVPLSPLAGLAPLLGVYGISLATALTAVALASAWRHRRAPRRALRGSLATIALWLGAGAAGMISWTHPVGPPLEVALVQGNVPQELKFREDRLIETLSNYAQRVEATTAPLVILPESALPLLLSQLPPDYVERLAKPLRDRGGDLVLGVFDNDPPGSDRYFNAAVSLGTAPMQHYRKHHLVPLGEFIPLKFLLRPVINDWLQIPLSDLARGDARQPPMAVAGQQLAVNICYEDSFGEEIIRALPQATLLANLTNDAWYGDSWASEQHLQLSQTRALETGRVMLRATNTGRTAVIDERGRITAQLEEFRAATLTAAVQGRGGATPYVHTGNGPALMLAVTLLVCATSRIGRRR